GRGRVAVSRGPLCGAQSLTSGVGPAGRELALVEPVATGAWRWSAQRVLVSLAAGLAAAGRLDRAGKSTANRRGAGDAAAGHAARLSVWFTPLAKADGGAAGSGAQLAAGGASEESRRYGAMIRAKTSCGPFSSLQTRPLSNRALGCPLCELNHPRSI